MANNQLVDSAALARRFNVTVGTVNGWVRRGLVPFIRPSRRVVRFNLAKVEEALEGRKLREAREEAAS